MDIFENDNKLKKSIGAFIIAFSGLEYGLAVLCSWTDFDLRQRDLTKYLGYSFDQKREVIKNYVYQYLPNLKDTWDKINIEIGEINKERRFIAHGFIDYYLPNDNISTYIKDRGKVVSKKQSPEIIDNLTSNIYKINTGKNGINGEFHINFIRDRIDLWNDFVIEELRFTYEIDGQIVTKWKGKI